MTGHVNETLIAPYSIIKPNRVNPDDWLHFGKLLLPDCSSDSMRLQHTDSLMIFQKRFVLYYLIVISERRKFVSNLTRISALPS